MKAIPLALLAALAGPAAWANTPLDEGDAASAAPTFAELSAVEKAPAPSLEIAVASVEAVVAPASAVAEPQTWALMLAGLAAVGWLGRRR